MINPISQKTDRQRIIVGISGASGSSLALRLLHIIKKETNLEIHLIMTDSAILTANYELGNNGSNILISLADEFHKIDALGDAISSGTFDALGMIIIPCSMKTIAGIANGYSDNLLLRSADVTIKEKRPLVLVAREMPLSTIHLKNLYFLSKFSCITIMPPMLSYYTNPQSIKDMEEHIIAKILGCFHIEISNSKQWKGINAL